MGLMDKVKAQATQLAEKAQEAGKAGQAKLEQVQAKRHVDNLLRELGAHTFLQHKGRGDGETATKVSTLISQIDAHEAEHGPIDVESGDGTGAGAASAGDGDVVAAQSVPTANVGGIPKPVNEVPTQEDAPPTS